MISIKIPIQEVPLQIEYLEEDNCLLMLTPKYLLYFYLSQKDMQKQILHTPPQEMFIGKSKKDIILKTQKGLQIMKKSFQPLPFSQNIIKGKFRNSLFLGWETLKLKCWEQGKALWEINFQQIITDIQWIDQSFGLDSFTLFVSHKQIMSLVFPVMASKFFLSEDELQIFQYQDINFKSQNFYAFLNAQKVAVPLKNSQNEIMYFFEINPTSPEIYPTQIKHINNLKRYENQKQILPQDDLVISEFQVKKCNQIYLFIFLYQTGRVHIYLSTNRLQASSFNQKFTIFFVNTFELKQEAKLLRSQQEHYFFFLTEKQLFYLNLQKYSTIQAQNIQQLKLLQREIPLILFCEKQSHQKIIPIFQEYFVKIIEQSLIFFSQTNKIHFQPLEFPNIDQIYNDKLSQKSILLKQWPIQISRDNLDRSEHQIVLEKTELIQLQNQVQIEEIIHRIIKEENILKEDTDLWEELKNINRERVKNTQKDKIQKISRNVALIQQRISNIHRKIIENSIEIKKTQEPSYMEWLSTFDKFKTKIQSLQEETGEFEGKIKGILERLKGFQQASHAV